MPFRPVSRQPQQGRDVPSLFEALEPRVLLNADPFANPEIINAVADTPISIDVVANDTDADGDPLTVAALPVPTTFGTAEIVGNEVLYTPNPGFTGQDHFAYTVEDGNGGSDGATVIILVAPSADNTRPYAEQDELPVTNDGNPVLLDVLANDTDDDGDPLILSAITVPPPNGTATIVGNQVQYTPNPGFNGQDYFAYAISDGRGGSDGATAILQVTGGGGPNTNPFAGQDELDVLYEGTPVLLDVLANDFDADGDPLSITAITVPPPNGTATLVGNLVQYTPNPGFTGQDYFGYSIADGNGGADGATAILQVTTGSAPNTNPFAGQDEVNVTNDGTPATIDVLANDTDADGDTLTISAITVPPPNGTAVIVDNQVEYTPNPGFTGQDYFGYSISDGNGGTDGATAVIQVSPQPNRDPVAVDDDTTVQQGLGTVPIDVLPNDSDPDSDPLDVVSITQPDHGSATLNSDVIFYTPDPGYTGPDSLDYTITDNRGGTATATLNITVVAAPNTDPVANDDTATVDRGSTDNVLDVLANDDDFDGDPLTLVSVTQPTNGTAALGTGIHAGKVLYTPDPGYDGPDSFTYTLDDGNGGTATGTVNLTVNPPANTDPDAVDDNVAVEQDSGIAVFDVLANDTDDDGDPLTITAVTQGAHGSVALGAGADAGKILYTAQSGYSGPDTFTYTIEDGNGGSDTATVNVDVTPVNRGVIALGSDVYFVDEDAGTLTFSIVRTGGTDGVVTAQYLTVDDTAVEGEDYVGFNAIATFADGQSEVFVDIPILNDDDDEPTEFFAISLNAVGGGVGLGGPRTANVSILDDDLPLVGDGLNAIYWSNQDFTGNTIERIDPQVNFDWGLGGPGLLFGGDTFSARWTGQVLIPESGTYTFATNSDDGIRLWVNRELLIDNWTLHAETRDTGTINLSAGQLVDIQVDFFERTGNAVAELFWTVPGQAETLIPTAALFSTDIEPIDPNDGRVTLQAETVVSGLSSPIAVEFAPNGDMFIAQKNGVVRVFSGGQLLSTPFVDHSVAVNNVRDRGLLDIALHPDFPNTPYVYLLYTYDPPETQGQSGLAAPDQTGNRPARLSRFTADPSTGYRTAVPGSEVVILGTNSTWDNISRPDLDSTNNFSIPPSGFDENGEPIQDYLASDSQSHTVGSLEFALDGTLFVSVGDGTSYGGVDPRTDRVQSIDNLSGKILRIDPITGDGIADNPFYNGDPDANRSKVFAFGVRNAFRIALEPTSGDLYIGDVGWNTWEEINVSSFAGGGGENFGWPYYEGAVGGSLQTGGYKNLPTAQAFYASNPDVTAPIWARDHAGSGSSIVLGDFYTGTTYVGYEDTLFFTDFNRPTIQAIVFNPDGSIQQIVDVTTPIGAVVEMSMGLDDHMYYVDLVGGVVGRFVQPGN